MIVGTEPPRGELPRVVRSFGSRDDRPCDASGSDVARWVGRLDDQYVVTQRQACDPHRRGRGQSRSAIERCL